MHLPIGIPNSVDQLKTFVEAEGNFSPGFGSYGIYFWVRDAVTKEFYAPTHEGARCEHGLGAGGALIPWSQWRAGEVAVKTEVCEVERGSPAGPVFIVAARVELRNESSQARVVWLDAALRPVGAAGGPVRRIEARQCRALLVDGHPALVGERPATVAGVAATDTIGELCRQGRLPEGKTAESASGDCSGALSYCLELRPGEARRFGFVCPVLPGRRVVGHRWDGVSAWAQLDLNAPNPAEGGVRQPDPGFDYYAGLKVESLFKQAAKHWQALLGRVSLELPDPRWAESFGAIVAHCAMNLNEGAPDVAVVNYNVFNRDGMYIANIFQKSGNFSLAEQAIAYFLRHPFNGRVQPEADNPGQILFLLGEHWRFTRDRRWLARVYPAAQRLAAMIRHYRATPGPHWVSDSSLDFGEALPAGQRKELKPGACDGYNPNYTEAYDIAGLRAAADLAAASGQPAAAGPWRQLADELMRSYDQKFGTNLARGYGSYAALWPCRLYPLGPAGVSPSFSSSSRTHFHSSWSERLACQQFRDVGAQHPADWRYFPLARAHQGLLAGNRAAGWQTLNFHLDHEQMRGWYALDEGGPSGVGGWGWVRTTWPITPLPWDKHTRGTVAMPHGWAVAEFHLLLRDCLLYEDGGRLVLFAGVPPEWFTHRAGMRWRNLPTHFGPSSVHCQPRADGAEIELSGPAKPPQGFALRLPPGLAARASAGGQELPICSDGGVMVPPGTRRVRLLLRR